MNEVTLLEEIYLNAIQRSDVHQREAYLDSACRNDPELRGKVDELLKAHGELGQFLEQPIEQTHLYSQHKPVEAITPGNFIAGRYKLLERIGEGGMSEAWMADQTEPIKHRVAVKLIKSGMDSRVNANGGPLSAQAC